MLLLVSTSDDCGDVVSPVQWVSQSSGLAHNESRWKIVAMQRAAALLTHPSFPTLGIEPLNLKNIPVPFDSSFWATASHTLPSKLVFWPHVPPESSLWSSFRPPACSSNLSISLLINWLSFLCMSKPPQSGLSGFICQTFNMHSLFDTHSWFHPSCSLLKQSSTFESHCCVLHLSWSCEIGRPSRRCC